MCSAGHHDQRLLCWKSSGFDRGSRYRRLWKSESDIYHEGSHRPAAVSNAVETAMLTTDEWTRVYDELQEGKVAGRIVLDVSM